ncbi:MAG: sulfatase [Flavobacteriaceae bacterium]|tara:strand:- start:51 stop:1469 length:1419 start_codon:yes stop_codon:yes gene_type:complete
MKIPKCIFFIVIISTLFFGSCNAEKDSKKPNVIFILTDDLGYEDLATYGSTFIKTPNLDKLADQGAKLTSYYATQAVCSASRASILTGCYPNRIGISGALGPNSKTGINPDEFLISEMLKENGYNTAIYGKWHLGDHKKFFPTRHGFDDFYGILYSNDMWPYHPERPGGYPDLKLYENENVIKVLEDQSDLTKKLTEKSIEFIKRNKENPFFLYIPHPQPHVPLFASEKFNGRSKKGLYADVIEEIDDSVGQIMNVLQQYNLDNNTIIIFTSDNGPWLSYGGHAGKTGLYREGKGTTWEGGQRVPCIVRFPKEIKKNTIVSTPVMGIDWLPTISNLTNSKVSNNKIDGKNIWKVLTETDPKPVHDALFFYYHKNSLHSVRYGDWKMYYPHRYRTLNGKAPRNDGMPIKYDYLDLKSPELYNLKNDPSEKVDVYNNFPEIVSKINLLAKKKRKELGDDLTGIVGDENRPVGTL